MFEKPVFPDSQAGGEELSRLAHAVLDRLKRLPERAYSGRSAAALGDLLACDLGAREPAPEAQILERLDAVMEHSINVGHPNTIAHFHCQTLIPAVVAELLASILNPSMDTFDQAPAATIVEQQLLRHLCNRVGFPDISDGTFTPGATQSNLFGLLLAREAALQKWFGTSGWREGLGDAARRLRILCSEAAHFTVEKSAAQLGLGTQAVVRVACDREFRISASALRQAVEAVQREGSFVMAIVATAGTTDFGSIDPLDEVGEIARWAGAWFHIDAAYAGALLFSSSHCGKLAGIDRADSVAIDFHKLLWQPLSCGVFLARDAADFDSMRMHAAYLNPEDEPDSVQDLVTRSLLTSRRFDALKLWVTLQLLGTRQLEAMIDGTLAQAAGAAAYIRTQPRLELLHEPELGCLVFRYLPRREDCDRDGINAQIRRKLFEAGDAVIGQTRVHGRTCLRLTCLNPQTTLEQLRRLLDAIVLRGISLENTPGAAG